jgi:DNA-directed RNA polymerase specialized sigma24 family protein
MNSNVTVVTVEAPKRRRVRRKQIHLDTDYICSYRTPETPWEALMTCEAGSEPPLSRLELLAVRDLLTDAVEQLDPRRRWVFEAVFIERRPMRTIADQMSLSLGMVHKLSVQARTLLYEYLRDDPIVKEYLGR